MIDGNGNNVIEGNFIGVDPTGSSARGNRIDGIFVSSSGNRIGGTTVAARNVISANGRFGVDLSGTTATGNLVQGNFIGTDAAGTQKLGNGGDGVNLFGATNNTIGGLGLAGNVISGNGGSGVILVGAGTNTIQGNFVGTDATSTVNLGNGSHGVFLQSSGISGSSASNNTIGGTVSAGNVIAFNSGAGVAVRSSTLNGIVQSNSSTRNLVRSNAIFSNSGLGIDLFEFDSATNMTGLVGVTPNDTGDTDSGANNLQNFPVLTSALSSGGTTTVQGTLNSTSSTQFTLEFFSNSACDASGNGQGAALVGAANVLTDETGNVSFGVPFGITVASGRFITSTATDPLGNTSEFSMCVRVNPSVSLTPDPLILVTRATGILTVTLSHPADAIGQTVTLTSSDGTIASVPSTVSIPGGALTTTVNVTTGTTAGTPSITAATQGFATGTSQVNVTLRTMTLSTLSPLVGVGHTLSGTINLAQPAPAGGAAIHIVSDQTSKATVSPSDVVIAQGSQSGSFTVSGVAAGSFNISATAVGFDPMTLPLTATTNSLITLGTGLVVAPGNSAGIALSIGIPAPSGGVTVTLSSSDISIATVTPSVFIPQGLQIPASNPVVQGVAIGTVAITATAAGFAPDSQTVTVTLTLSISPTSLTVINGQTSNVTLNLSSPAPAGGLNFNTSIDNTSFATVPATVHVNAGSTSVQVQVSGVGVGSTILRASALGVTQATAAITVNPPPAISVGDATVGKDLQVAFSGSLGAAAPAGGRQVTITSLDASKLLLASSPTAAGGASLVLTVGAGSFSTPTFYVQALTDTGTAQFQTTASGYATGTSTVTFWPSGFTLLMSNFTTTTFSPNTALQIYTVVLDPTTLNYAGTQSLRGGLTVSVPVTNSDPTVGAIVGSPAVFNGGDGYLNASVAFDPNAAGTSTIGLITPPGFTTPSNYQQITATVNP